MPPPLSCPDFFIFNFRCTFVPSKSVLTPTSPLAQPRQPRASLAVALSTRDAVWGELCLFRLHLSSRVPRAVVGVACRADFVGLTCVWMASSSSQCGAAPPPPPDQLASLYKLVDKIAITGALCRYARTAEASASAAMLAVALFREHDSLVVTNLRAGECQSLCNLSAQASGEEQEALYRRAWAVLLSLLPLLLRRIEADTLMPGTIREEELDFYAHMDAAGMQAQNRPFLPPPEELRVAASVMGYNTLLSAIFSCLNLLPAPSGLRRRREWWSRLCSEVWASFLSQSAYQQT